MITFLLRLMIISTQDDDDDTNAYALFPAAKLPLCTQAKCTPFLLLPLSIFRLSDRYKRG